jgi:hypothetical protein
MRASPVVADFDTTLEPGVRHSYPLGASSLAGAYVVEMSPLQPIHGHIEHYAVDPEFDGAEWNDVLRALVPLDRPSLEVNVRAYRTIGWPVANEITATLEPGEWHGFTLGPSSLNRRLVAEIDPLQPSIDGARIERSTIGPEFDGAEWNDVLRVQVPAGDPPLTVHINVYETAEALVTNEFNTTLQPGDWQGYFLGESSSDQGFLVEITPLEPSVDGAYVERCVIQPEFDGTQWNDILRLQIPAGDPPLEVNVRFSALPAHCLYMPAVWGSD